MTRFITFTDEEFDILLAALDFDILLASLDFDRRSIRQAIRDPKLPKIPLLKIKLKEKAVVIDHLIKHIKKLRDVCEKKLIAGYTIEEETEGDA